MDVQMFGEWVRQMQKAYPIKYRYRRFNDDHEYAFTLNGQVIARSGCVGWPKDKYRTLRNSLRVQIRHYFGKRI